MLFIQFDKIQYDNMIIEDQKIRDEVLNCSFINLQSITLLKDDTYIAQLDNRLNIGQVYQIMNGYDDKQLKIININLNI